MAHKVTRSARAHSFQKVVNFEAGKGNQTRALAKRSGKAQTIMEWRNVFMRTHIGASLACRKLGCRRQCPLSPIGRGLKKYPNQRKENNKQGQINGASAETPAGLNCEPLERREDDENPIEEGVEQNSSENSPDDKANPGAGQLCSGLGKQWSAHDPRPSVRRR